MHVCTCIHVHMHVYLCVSTFKILYVILPEAIISQKYSIMIASKLSLSDLRKISIKTELAHQ